MRNVYVKVAVLSILLLMPLTARAQLQPIYVQQSAAAEAKHAFGGTMLSALTVSWQTATTARYLMIFDGAVPSNGATSSCTSAQAVSCLAWCGFLPSSTVAPGLNTVDWGAHPLITQNGVSAALSTGAGCGTLTLDGNNDFFMGQVR